MLSVVWFDILSYANREDILHLESIPWKGGSHWPDYFQSSRRAQHSRWRTTSPRRRLRSACEYAPRHACYRAIGHRTNIPRVIRSGQRTRQHRAGYVLGSNEGYVLLNNAELLINLRRVNRPMMCRFHGFAVTGG